MSGALVSIVAVVAYVAIVGLICRFFYASRGHDDEPGI